MGLPPGVRQTVKTLFAGRWKPSTGKTTLQHSGDRLVKRRLALVETNPPRNSQPETDPDDERGLLA